MKISRSKEQMKKTISLSTALMRKSKNKKTDKRRDFCSLSRELKMS